MRLGCYLDDLCLEPVNHLPEAMRRQKRTNAEKSLAVRVRDYSPHLVVAIGKATAAPHVQSVLAAPGLTEIAFNHSLYRLVLRRRGPAAAASGVVLHAVHHVTGIGAAVFTVVRTIARLG
jgi:hypothetical protein